MVADVLALDDVDLAVDSESTGACASDDEGAAVEVWEGYDFEVVASREAHGTEPLGVDVICRKRFAAMEVVAVRERGAIPRWNANRGDASERVACGDYILAVNGRMGSIRGMVQALKWSAELHLLMRRSISFEVVLHRVPGQRLGITIAKESTSLVVAAVSDTGAVPDWNHANADRQLLCGDVLVEANGVSGASSAIMEVLAQDPPAPILRILARRQAGVKHAGEPWD
mmetsp:Transcript_19453/g.56524  ORF Transcript_19453/g.56524 Transcript_19453/m.56524 type:complete len:228 (+) Transcript_19453:28-711(+)